jgi:GNAT superfamily N-acetyltransferase
MKILLDLTKIKNSEYKIEDFLIDEKLRGNKLGSYLLSALCQWADEKTITLIADPYPFDSDEPEFKTWEEKAEWTTAQRTQLIRWYEKFGFEPTINQPIFTRKPK